MLGRPSYHYLLAFVIETGPFSFAFVFCRYGIERSLLPLGGVSIPSEPAGLQHRGNRSICISGGDSGEDHGDG